MFSWLAKAILTRNMARLRGRATTGRCCGSTRRTSASASPATAPWATRDRQPRRPRRLWLQRFVADRPEDLPGRGDRRQGRPPWNTTLCVRGTGPPRTGLRAGSTRTAASIWGRMSWGLLREYEVLRGHAGEQGARRVSWRHGEDLTIARPAARRRRPCRRLPGGRGDERARARRPADYAACLDALGGPLPRGPHKPRQVLDELVADADPGLTGMNHAPLLRLRDRRRVPAAIAADWLTSAWDQNAGLAADAPPRPRRGGRRRLAADLLGLPATRRSARHRLPDGARDLPRRRAPPRAGRGGLGRRAAGPDRRAADPRARRRGAPRHRRPGAAAARLRHRLRRAGRTSTRGRDARRRARRRAGDGRAGR